MYGTGREESGKGKLAALVGRHLLNKAYHDGKGSPDTTDGRKLLDPRNLHVNKGDLIVDPQQQLR